MSGNGNWHLPDDLDGGLSTDLLNLSGLGNDLAAEPQAYKMSDVLNLPIFKENTPLFDELPETAQKHSFSLVSKHTVKEEEQMVSCSQSKKRTNNGDLSRHEFYHVLSAPTAPGRKVGEDTLTYLNQGQSYLINLKSYGDVSRFEKNLIKSKVKLTFYEKKLQIQEAEKFEEWRNNRPLERILEVDVPMSSGIHNIVSEGNQSNSYSFEWNSKNETKLYVIINCVSSEFTKGKSGGESGVPLQVQIETKIPDSSTSTNLIHSSSCQVKVFKSKGGDRKHKNEMQKLENKPHDEVDHFQVSNEFTVLKEKFIIKEADGESWHSPNKGLSPRPSPSSVVSPSSTSLLVNQSLDLSSPDVLSSIPTELTSKSTIKETRAWLQENRFSHYLSLFTNYTGSDLLRLTRHDMIQLIGPADGIRLYNTLQLRTTRPLLTVYICMESTQQDSGMKEYHAMYLEALDAAHLRKKLAKKCSLSENQIVAMYRQGPTGIYILVDDEMLRNFQDESHFVVHIIQEPESSAYRLILK